MADKKITHQKHVDDLVTFLRIPTISTQPKHYKDILEAVAFLEKQLHAVVFRRIEKKWAKGCENMPPIIFAERIDNPTNPTLLVYNHYDVQPADPLEEWKKPPFGPSIENNNIYGLSLIHI